jgi:hypothetical protein
VADQQRVRVVAVATTKDILWLIGGCLRDEERLDAFAEIYERVKEGIEAFDADESLVQVAAREGVSP